MIYLSYSVIIEFFIGIFLWWIAVYLFIQNPFSRLIQVISAILAVMSLYITSDLFMFVAINAQNPRLSGEMLRIFSWTIYLPAPLLYHVSYLLIKKDQRKTIQKIYLYISYLFSFLVIYLESSTNLTRDYNLLNSAGFTGNYTNVTGQYFWITAVFYMAVLSMTAANFYFLLKKQSKKSREWYKYFWPFVGLVVGLLVSPFIVLSYYNIIFSPNFFDGAIGMVILGGTLIYSVIRYDLLVEEARIIFGKAFLYSTIAIVIILALYLITLSPNGIQFPTIKSLIVPFIFSYLIIITHPIYVWVTTFVRDLIFNIHSGISIVNDSEVYDALKNFNNPEVLENSPLLRLNLVKKALKSDVSSTPVDALRAQINQAIEYFNPTEDVLRRTKQNLKFHLLKMIAFDQAEEGQMLWELGFDEYPLRIMARESGSSPSFQTKSPSDYSYVSRNSFLALKKEAIHNVAWRISYLEKLTKKKGI